ncbi:hypothetical protein ASG49_02680 [Marmoricola sp. Leaf446]|uniref:DUF2231 domain-containing protein n=1 Tax=Marmoricola sp. Leaf446 TaxID=1736379 RepID=UPI0006F49BE3|nr:DUF2231 domain-containing protein [Marmoricola sp. Leaf446]KQT93879.1 hypothetical protein ASG49_02680 [Marmoricola sp. Leaf446]
MEINGIPAHPLVIHAAVVLVPLAALSVIAFVVPRWRAAARWPALVLTVVATVAVQLATLTGENLEETRGPDNALIHEHAEWGERLQVLMYVLAVLVVVAFLVMPVVHRATGRDRPARVAVLEKPLMVLLPLLAVAAVVIVVITGDLGAQSVWGG